MAEYLCEEDMNTGEYISRDEALKIFHQCCDNCTSSYNGVMCRACADAGAMDILIDMPAADVQPIYYAENVQNEVLNYLFNKEREAESMSYGDKRQERIATIREIIRFVEDIDPRMDGKHTD